MELYDALESSGSYSKAEITERVDKYRDKLMQVNPLCGKIVHLVVYGKYYTPTKWTFKTFFSRKQLNPSSVHLLPDKN